jgi:two-component system CheB/CheR fusion protein
MIQHFIAAIAGSAGSHERLLEFFDHTPHDDVSYVILQHLPANWQSQLALVLSRHAKLDVKEIRNGMVIHNDIIYTVPPGKYVTIKCDTFALADRTENVHQTADAFMESLALNSGKKAIGVILEGVLNDGTTGIRAIHEAGGLTIAQHPATCRFYGMPESAIRSGAINKIAEVEAMPDLIHSYVSELQRQETADTPSPDQRVSR